MLYWINCFYLLQIISQFRANEFDYEHQAKWYDDYEECGMQRQSPIELNSNEAYVSYEIPTLTFINYGESLPLKAKSENNGHTANIELCKPLMYNLSFWQEYDKLLPYISNGPLPGTRFIAESVHFHWGSKDTHGSEHVIDGQRYSMEMHIVHRNTKYKTVDEARSFIDGLAVLSVLFKATLEQKNSFKGLGAVLNSLTTISGYNKSADISNFSLENLIGDLDCSEFYTYSGSLTTPPCSQAVTWIVIVKTIPILHDQIDLFHQLSDRNGFSIENNYRALQARGDRLVQLRKKRHVVESVIIAPHF